MVTMNSKLKILGPYQVNITIYLEHISRHPCLLVEMRRENLQPDRVDGSDVPHVDVLGVDKLGVHEVAGMLDRVENTLRVNL